MGWLVYSNLWIALAAALCTLQTDVMLGAKSLVDPLVATIFLGTWIVYNLDRLCDPQIRASSSPRHRWIVDHVRPLWGLVILNSVVLLTTVSLLPWRAIASLVVLGLVGIAYSFPLLAKVPRASDRLREIAGLKALWVAGVWTAVTVILPAVEHPRISLAAADVAALCLERFLFLVAITMPFDLRDEDRDAAIGLSTISSRLGFVGTRRLCVALMAVSSALSAVHWSSRPSIAAAMTASGVAALALLANLRPALRDAYYEVGLDGTLVLRAGLVLLASGCDKIVDLAW